MNILMVPLLKRKMGPQVTASRPRVIFELTQGLIARGHKVSVLGTKNSSIPGAKIIPVIPKSMVEMGAYENPFYAETGYLVQLAKHLQKISGQFDIIHNHTYPEFINLLVEPLLRAPMVTTVHAQMTPELDQTLSGFPDSKLISLSQAHKRLAHKTKFWKVIYNGIDTDVYRFSAQKENYLLWIGRLGKARDAKGQFIDAKGVRNAIRLAEETGQRLLLAGNVEDKKFFDQDVKPHLNKKIQWVGEVSSEQSLTKFEVAKLMAKAKGFLMTINWEEPFGLVMAEAMSCGTPVVGFKRGAVPELVEHGKTGFVAKDFKGLVQGVKKLGEINPAACRARVEKYFSLDITVGNYYKAYQQAIKEWKHS
ncbi:MAG: glycosyltransferase family 4 protein [Patescibacteria group bacterium]